MVPEPGPEADRDQVKAGETMSKGRGELRQGPRRQGPEQSLEIQQQTGANLELGQPSIWENSFQCTFGRQTIPGPSAGPAGQTTK